MRSRISYFNKTLYLKNMARFWPIWALYGIIWLFAMPRASAKEDKRFWEILNMEDTDNDG